MSREEALPRDPDALVEVRAALRQTWPSLTDMDVGNLPNTRAEAAELIRRKTGAPLDEIQTTLSELYGLVPERHEVDPTVDSEHPDDAGP